MYKLFLSCLIFFICLFPSDIFAATYTFNMPHSKPFAGDNAGYINVYYIDANDKVTIRTIGWFWTPADNTNQGNVVHSYVDVDVTADKVTLSFRKPTTVAACELTYYAMGEAWFNIYESSGTYTNNTTQTYTPGNIIYVETFGNIGTVNDPFSAIFHTFVVNWSDTYTSNGYLSELVDQLAEQNVLTQDILDKLNEFYGSDIDVSINDNSNSNLDSSVNDYDQIESGLVDDFNNSITDIDTNLNIFNVSDFLKTGSFLSTQLTNIFNSNVNISNMIMFSLIMGFAFVLIGIGVKR